MNRILKKFGRKIKLPASLFARGRFRFLKFSWRKFVPILLVLTIVFIGVAGPIFYSTAHASVVAKLADLAVGSIGNLMAKVLSWIAQTIFTIIAALLYLAGSILDVVISQTIVSFASLVGSNSIVGVGWTIIRDLSNLVFIFLILWVAISTILGLSSGGGMKGILRIAIAAVLINFSLFITQAIIDVANIFALHFYNLILGVNSDGQTGTFSGVFMQGMYIQTLFDVHGGGFGTISGTATDSKVMLSYVLGSIAALVAIWIFLAAAVMFAIRALYLIVLMVLSPFAFIAWVVPGMAKYTSEWWHKLLSQSFFAPVFMIMIYIVGKAIQTPAGAFGIKTQGTLSDMTTALASGSAVNPGAVNILINFILIIGMLIASLLVASKMGVVGASTAISWGKKVQGVGQSWVAGRSVGMIARNLDERFGKTYFGNTSVGKKLREITTIPMKDAKWGGRLSAEDRHKEDLELASKREEAMKTQGAGLSGRIARTSFGALAKRIGVEVPENTEHNVEAIVQNIDRTKDENERKIAPQKAKVDELEIRSKAAPADAALKTQLEKEQGSLEDLETKMAETLQHERGELQRLLVKLTPHSFAEMMPKKLLFTEEVMRNASRAQFMTVLGSDKFAEIEKSKVRGARYGHIERAEEQVEKANEGYEQKYQNYIAASTLVSADGDPTAAINKLLDEMGLGAGSAARHDQEIKLLEAVNKYRTTTGAAEKKKALKQGLDDAGFDKPKRKSINDVAPDVRTWMRAMADQESDEMYRYNSKMVTNPYVAMTLRSSVTRYMRQSENVASIDKDKMRDAKFRDKIDAADLADGFGELAPSLATFNHIIDNMVHLDIKDLGRFQHMSAKAYQTFKDDASAWEDFKDDELRKAVKKIAIGGRYQEYLDSFNDEQKSMASLGEEKMISAIEGKSADEFPIMRGVRWIEPAFARHVNRGMAQRFSEKDTNDIAELVSMVLHDFRNAYNSSDLSKVSNANLNLLSWIANDRTGQLFAHRDALSPQLQTAFDKMQEIMNGIKNINEDTLKKINDNIVASKTATMTI